MDRRDKKNMLPKSRRRKRQSGATIIMMLIMMPLLLIPLVGLGIDGTRLYIVQSKLSAAVDGAALGAGRLLGTAANTTEIAGEFLNVNFPSGYWSTSALQKNITYTNANGLQTISIYATVVMPLTFARMLGQSAALVSASSQAVRRVTRVELVLDRSGSMLGAPFTAMQAGAEWFASQFTQGYDEVGLVVFASSAVVAYPTTHPWINNTSGAGGPDTAFATNPQTMTGPIFTELGLMQSQGGTGTPEALSMAYVEMQKAHNRDLAANGYDNALNTIVLFTDGVPDSVATYLNDPADTSLKPYNRCGVGSTDPGPPTKCSVTPRAGYTTDDTTKSPCVNITATAGTASTQMRGYIVAGGYPVVAGDSNSGWQGAYGLGRLASLDTANPLSWWLSTAGAQDLTKVDPTTSTASMIGCVYVAAPANGTNDLLDLAKIPDHDLYGNATNSTAFTNSVMYNGTSTSTPNTYSYNYLTPTDPNMVAAAAWNVTDAIGKTIRTQAVMPQIQIFAIGYSGNAGGTDIGLLQRLANNPPPGAGVLTGSTSYVSSEPNGKVFIAQTTADLIPAFNAIASTLLRLAQ
jgi:Flp pilus assembly protein TadG